MTHERAQKAKEIMENMIRLEQFAYKFQSLSKFINPETNVEYGFYLDVRLERFGKERPNKKSELITIDKKTMAELIDSIIENSKLKYFALERELDKL